MTTPRRSPRKTMSRWVATALSIATIGLAGAVTAPAHAATGGAETDNPGIVSLIDDQGEHQCSAVLVDPEWALT